MATQAPIYDLMLLLSTAAEESQREKVLKDVEAAIAKAGGSIERDDDWGRRPLAYQIRHQPDAEYHLLQFTAPPTLIEDLSHTLRITDGVLRVRVIKVRPGTPAAPSSPPPVVAVASAPASSAASASGAPAPEAAGAGSETEAVAEPGPEAAAAPEPEAEAEPDAQDEAEAVPDAEAAPDAG